MDSCSTWYLDAKYKSKQDCLSQQHEASVDQDTTTVSSVDTGTSIGTQSGETTITTASIATTTPDEINGQAIGDEDNPAIVVFPSTVDSDSDESDSWNGHISDTTTIISEMATANDISTTIFTPEEVFAADKIEVRPSAENGKTRVHIEFGGLQLGLVIAGSAVGVVLLVYGLIKLADYITKNILNMEVVPNGGDQDRSNFPLTGVQPTAPEDTREIEETNDYRTAMESTLVAGHSSGAFRPPISPLRSSSLPNIPSSSNGQRLRAMDRTQSTIAFNIDDTIGGEFDQLAMRHQPAELDLSNLTVLRTTSRIFEDAERNQAGPSGLGQVQAEAGPSGLGQVQAEAADGAQSATEAKKEPETKPAVPTEQTEEVDAPTDPSGRRKSTRSKKQFKPTQYGDL